MNQTQLQQHKTKTPGKKIDCTGCSKKVKPQAAKDYAKLKGTTKPTCPFCLSNL